MPLLAVWAILLALGWPAPEEELRGSWSASTDGRLLSGTWTARAYPDPQAAWGEWALRDAAGRRLASGTWSARKAANEWRGSWRAESGRGPGASGEWTARSKLPPSAGFIELLRAAVGEVVSGAWTAGALSGSWSIRAAGE